MSFENTVGKGEIARDEQFLFFPQCFLLSAIFIKIQNVVCKLFQFGRVTNLSFGKPDRKPAIKKPNTNAPETVI